MNLHIVAVFRFKENDVLDAIELLKKLVNETRKEEGCLRYDLIEDKYTMGTFFIIENWESEEHHFKHSGSDHLANFRLQSASLLAEQTVVYKGFKIF